MNPRSNTDSIGMTKLHRAHSTLKPHEPQRPTKSKAIQPAKPGFDGLLRGLREFIAESRRQVLRAVDVVQVRTCWGVGRHIVEFEQGGAARAEYGAKLLPQLA